jgi:predicted phosphodiesterase
MLAYNFVHLSDIHFGQQEWNAKAQEDVRSELLLDAQKLRNQMKASADYVLVTGDTAFSGKMHQYEKAGEWLSCLCSVVGCKETAVLVIPGNHDVEQTEITKFVKDQHNNIRSAPVQNLEMHMAEIFGDKHADILLSKLSNYLAFSARYDCEFESCTKPHYAVDLPNVAPAALRIVGLNTALISEGTDLKGKLVLGRNQYIVTREKGIEYVILMHHPLPWIIDEIEARKFLYSRARVILTGHEHDLELQQITNAQQHSILWISAGAVTPPQGGSEVAYRYNWLTFDAVQSANGWKLCVDVRPRIWQPSSTAFDADRNYLGGTECASYAFALPDFTNPELGVKPNKLGIPVQNELPNNAGELKSAEVPRRIELKDVNTKRLEYLYWTVLTKNERLEIMVELQILPKIGNELTLSLERRALEIAENAGKHKQLWDAVMFRIEPAKREPNPF